MFFEKIILAAKKLYKKQNKKKFIEKDKRKQMEFKHKPVLLKECIDGLKIKADGIYVDGTLRRSRA